MEWWNHINKNKLLYSGDTENGYIDHNSILWQFIVESWPGLHSWSIGHIKSNQYSDVTYHLEVDGDTQSYLPI